MIRKVLLLFISSFCLAACLKAKSKDEVYVSPGFEKDFFLLTFPKSGTHLVEKLLISLTGKKSRIPSWKVLGKDLSNISYENIFYLDNALADIDEMVFENFMKELKSANQFSKSHFYFSGIFKKFSADHPEYAKILQIRDLRDVLVSYVFMDGRSISAEIGSDSFDDMLMFMINLGPGDVTREKRIFNIYRHAEKAVEWMREPNVLVCRFEDMVGASGGGTYDLQRQLIIDVANHIQASLDEPLLYYILKTLFGTRKGPQLNTTFRLGQIGEWRRYFKKTHIKAFASKYGQLQQALGYTF